MTIKGEYYNANGHKVSLERLCSEEPAWAANRILTLTEELIQERMRTWPIYIYQDSDQEITTINVYRKALEDCVKAMIYWGNQEDGIPEDGVIGEAFDRAKAILYNMPNEE